MTNNFDKILAGLHTNDSTSTLTDSSGVVTINEKREFELPSDGYDTVLAYSGDINSQIITFQLPETHEGHNLFGCKHKKLKWKNLSSGIDGVSDLIEVEDEGENGIVKWEIPPEAFTQAGVLEISLSLYDVKNEIVVFSWNTPTSTVFSVGSGFEEVPLDLTLPAENEILLICENKQIVAPKGYNNHIANFGEVGTTKVYFQCKKNVAGIDLTEEVTSIEVLINFDNATYKDPNKPTIKEISEESVLIIWETPPEVTNNENQYSGNIKISLIFGIKDKDNKFEKCWKTSSYSQLYIGDALVKDLDNSYTFPTLEESVGAIVNDIIENSNEIWRANWEQTDENGKGYIENKPPIKKGSGEGSIEENGGKATGLYSYASGQNTQAMGMGSRAEGKDTISKGHYSHAEGHRTSATGNSAHAEGLNTKALGHRSHAEGNSTTAGNIESGDKGESAHAEGHGTTSSAIASHAEGESTIASGGYSHAEGLRTWATLNAAHAEGGYTKAIGHYAHAEGYYSEATTYYAHVEGQSARAIGIASHAEGKGTIASGEGQHVQGRYNIYDSNKAHIVGGGFYDKNTSTEIRKNIHTLDWDGNAWFAGDIRVGETEYDKGYRVANEYDLSLLENKLIQASGANSITRKTIGNRSEINLINPYGKAYFSKISGATGYTQEIAHEDKNPGIIKYEYTNGENTILAEGDTITLNGSFPDLDNVVLQLTKPLATNFSNITVDIETSGSYSEAGPVNTFLLGLEDRDQILNGEPNKYHVQLDWTLSTFSLKNFMRKIPLNGDWTEFGEEPFVFNNFTIKLSVYCAYYEYTYTPLPLKTIIVQNSKGDKRYPIPEQLQTLPGFGLRKSDTVCNYIDFEEQIYYQNCKLTNGGTVIEEIDTIQTDISDILNQDDGIIDVTGATGISLMVGTSDGGEQSNICFYELNYKSRID